MKNFFKEFQAFIKRGNVLDLAVAVIIGGAFGKIVSSLVNHVLMPTISILIGENGFENYKYVITPANEALNIKENAIYYGLFIQNIIDFLIIAFVIFIIIKIFVKINDISLLKKGKEIEVVKEPKPEMIDVLLDIKKLLEEKH